VKIKHIADHGLRDLSDPRLWGASSKIWSTDIANFLGRPFREKLQSIETRGKEEIHGRSAWHVRQVMPAGTPLNYWIDDSDHYFRVLRHSQGEPVVNRMTSVYENDDYPWLPSRITYEYMPHGGSTTILTVLETVEREEGFFPESHWTLAGMNLKVGMSVMDHTKDGGTIGYWDGKKISEDFVPKERKPSRKTRGLFILLLAVALSPLLWLWHAGIQRKNAGSLPAP